MKHGTLTALWRTVGLLLVAVLVGSGGAPAALAASLREAGSAAPLAVDCGFDPWRVATEAELSAAISCYNAKTTAKSYLIYLTDDIDLTANLPAINNVASAVSLTLEGEGYIISGLNITGVRPLTIRANTTVTINNLTVAGGNVTSTSPNGASGGGIYNGGSLTLTNSTVRDNTSSTEAGGIYNGGTLTIIGSTIRSNRADNQEGQASGGGIVTSPTSTTVIRNSTIAENRGATNAGGMLSAGTVLIENVTMAGNSAPSAASIQVGPLGTTTVRNSILAEDGNAANCLNGATLVDGGHNLVRAAGNCPFANGVNGTIVGVDPKLGFLDDNGGPSWTYDLLPGSPAIDAGDTTLTIDQRGVARPAGAADDIGAIETICGATSWTAGSEAELNAAVACFNARTAAGNSMITLADDIFLTRDVLTIDNPTSGASLTVAGDGYAIDALFTPEVRPLTIAVSTTVTLNELTVSGGSLSFADESGGGIYNEGALTINDSAVANNSAGRDGGGIYNEGALTITNSIIDGNSAETGGGVYNSGTLTVSGSTISGNDAGSNGGGIYSANGLSLTNSTISGNIASVGAGLQGAGTMVIESTTITANTAAGNGGGLDFKGFNEITARNSIIAGNSGPVDVTSLFGTLIDGGHNLFGEVIPTSIPTKAPTSQYDVDPRLGPLADNGGPTWTHALLAGSPAIDAGDTALSSDQRGAARPGGTADDIGAVEVAGGTVIIRNTTVPSGGPSFNFSGSLGSFTLKDGGKQSFFNVSSGTHIVTQTDPSGAGYSLSGLTCQDGDASGTASTVDVATRTATIKLDVGETISCRFTNTQDTPAASTLSVETVTMPDSTASFSFDGGSLGTFNMSTGQIKDFTNLAAGSYTLNQDDPKGAGFRVTAVVCTTSTGQTVSGNVAARSVTVDLAAGVEAHCTFTNARTYSVYLPLLSR
jgi:hypothetical protein